MYHNYYNYYLSPQTIIATVSLSLRFSILIFNSFLRRIKKLINQTDLLNIVYHFKVSEIFETMEITNFLILFFHQVQKQTDQLRPRNPRQRQKQLRRPRQHQRSPRKRRPRPPWKQPPGETPKRGPRGNYVVAMTTQC